MESYEKLTGFQELAGPTQNSAHTTLQVKAGIMPLSSKQWTQDRDARAVKHRYHRRSSVN